MSLSAEANATLAEQIETLSPSAPVLEAAGVPWQTAAELAKQIANGPDLAGLKDCGVGQDEAVAIATAISKRHARKAAALAAVPAPKPVPSPAPPKSAKTAPDEDSRLSALSLLHDLCLQMDAERGDAEVLSRAGFSWHTAKELADLINETRTT